MMLNVVMNEYFQSVRKIKHSKLKESPKADPRTRMEPTTTRYDMKNPNSDGNRIRQI